MAIPLLVAGGLAAGAAAGAGIGMAAGVGRNNTRVGSFGESNQYNKNAFQYGGRAGGVDDYTRAMYGRADVADRRMAPQADYSQAQDDRQMSLDARTGQANAANMMLARASGQVPSIAGQQAAIDSQRAAAQQASLAAGARGAGGLALASQAAATNTANAQAAISQQAQINAANERLAAEQAASGAFTGLRGTDLASQGQAANMAQFQAQQQLASRGQNDQRAMTYEQLAAQANNQQLQAQVAGQQTLANSFNNKMGLEFQQSQNNANNSKGWFEKLIPSDMNAKNPATLDQGQQLMGMGPGSGQNWSSILMQGLSSAAPAGAAGGAAAAGGAGAAGAAGGAAGLGSLATMLSDAAAKREAFLDGADYVSQSLKGTPTLPQYMANKPEPAAPAAAPYTPVGEQGYARNYNRGMRNGVDAEALAQPSTVTIRDQAREGSQEYTRNNNKSFKRDPINEDAVQYAVAEGNRQMQGSPYSYKPGLTPPEQAPGEVNVGPMAQNMAQNPVTATAIRKDPNTGMLGIDRDKALKVAMSGIGALQSQVDDLRGLLGRGGRK